MNYKPFNLEEALRGEKLITREGKEITDFYYFKNAIDHYPIRAVVRQHLLAYAKDGKYHYIGMESVNDLFMSPKTKTYWVNIYFSKETGTLVGKTWESREEAEDKKVEQKDNADYVKTISFEVEE